MKKVLLVITTSLCAAAAAFGALGDVLNSFPAPATYPIALGIAGDYTNFLWVYCNASPFRIYQISGITGSLLSSYVSPQGSATRGLTYSYNGGGGLPSGSYLWMGNYGTDYIYRCNSGNGSVYASIPANHDMILGIAVTATGDGGSAPTYMLSSDDYAAYMYRQALTTGSIYSSWTVAADVCDIAWDWRNAVVWTGRGDNYVYGYRTTGSLAASFRIPNDYPVGFCYTTNYLWVSCTIGIRPADYIYRIHCPLVPNLSVEPASVGRIKSLFK